MPATKVKWGHRKLGKYIYIYIFIFIYLYIYYNIFIYILIYIYIYIYLILCIILSNLCTTITFFLVIVPSILDPIRVLGFLKPDWVNHFRCFRVSKHRVGHGIGHGHLKTFREWRLVSGGGVRKSFQPSGGSSTFIGFLGFKKKTNSRWARKITETLVVRGRWFARTWGWLSMAQFFVGGSHNF